MLTAYWDESGSSKDPACAYVGMAGLVARKEDWQRFQFRWAATLQAHKLPYFHAAKMEHGLKPFRPKKDWPVRRKEELLHELLAAIRAANPRMLGAALDLSAWRALLPWQKRALLDPWFPCLQECVRTSVVVALFEDVVGDSIATVFSQQGEFASKATSLWESLVSADRLGYDRLRAFAMQDMRTTLPLQAADLVAYECVKAIPSIVVGSELRVAIRTLLSIDPRAVLLNIDAAYIDGQLAPYSPPEIRKRLGLDEREERTDGATTNG